MATDDRARKRTIITGGTGLIGRALPAELVTRGHEVMVLSRSPGRVGGLPKGVRAERWDGRSAAGWGPLVEGATAIVNLAGENLAEGRWTGERKQMIRESRLRAGQAVIDAVIGATQKPHVVIQASAGGSYGPPGDEIVTEQTLPGTDFLARVCADWEASTALVEAMGVSHAFIRTGIVLSREAG